MGDGRVGSYATAISATRDNTLFFIGAGGAVDGLVGSANGVRGSLFSLGGYAKQISAGLDAAGHPEVFAIGGDNSVYLNDNRRGWVDLDFPATAISAAPTGNTVYDLYNGSVYVYRGSSFTDLGGAAVSISAGTDWNGNPDVYAIGASNAIYFNDGGGWGELGGYATELSATSTAFLAFRGQDPGSIYGLTGLSLQSLGNIGGTNPSPGDGRKLVGLHRGNQPYHAAVRFRDLRFGVVGCHQLIDLGGNRREGEDWCHRRASGHRSEFLWGERRGVVGDVPAAGGADQEHVGQSGRRDVGQCNVYEQRFLPELLLAHNHRRQPAE